MRDIGHRLTAVALRPSMQSQTEWGATSKAADRTPGPDGPFPSQEGIWLQNPHTTRSHAAASSCKVR